VKLVGRVALASALAAAVGGVVASLSAGLTARSMLVEREQTSLREQAQHLADEVLDELQETADRDDDEEERAEHAALSALEGDRKLAWALAHELDDMDLAGKRAAIFAGETRVVGDATLRRPRADCELHTRSRVCAVPIAHRTLVLSANAQVARDQSLFSSALWIGLSCGAALGGVLSYALSRWALRPLTRLRDQVRAIPIDASDASSLAPLAQSELEELRAAIASLLERLAAALKQAQSFAAEAAHELRTPLTTLAGELELIDDQASIQRARRQVADLTELVQRLLVLAQSARLPERQMEIVDLSDVANELGALEPRIQVALEDDVIVRGDQALLRSLVQNALQNALKFSSGSVRLNIRKLEHALIEVEDEGPGIAPEERERVFRPFYRTPEARALGAGGHGIGLALIARVAWVHGGRAEFVERPRGACLRVYLPLWRPS
jgi:signal transduction histidine kinase